MMPDCEAESRITRALFALELDWGAGTFDYRKIRDILTGEQCQGHAEKAA